MLSRTGARDRRRSAVATRASTVDGEATPRTSRPRSRAAASVVGPITAAGRPAARGPRLGQKPRRPKEMRRAPGRIRPPGSSPPRPPGPGARWWRTRPPPPPGRPAAAAPRAACRPGGRRGGQQDALAGQVPAGKGRQQALRAVVLLRLERHAVLGERGPQRARSWPGPRSRASRALREPWVEAEHRQPREHGGDRVRARQHDPVVLVEPRRARRRAARGPRGPRSRSPAPRAPSRPARAGGPRGSRTGPGAGSPRCGGPGVAPRLSPR